MAQVVIMSQRYQKRPSEIMGITDDYMAYCFDELALRLEVMATDEKGHTNWNRLKWQGSPPKDNKDLMDFIAKQGGMVTHE